MGGLIVLSVVSGWVISKTGRYRLFPIAGTGITAIALYLLSTVTASTSTWIQSGYLVLLGVGLGSVMQVLLLITQNAVPQSELGVATSGATFFRSIGGSFGAAVFGAIFSNVLVGKLATQLHGLTLPAGFASSSVTPAMLDKLPAAVREGFVTAYANSIDTVLLIAVPVAVLAFAASWLIPQLELRRSTPPLADPPE
jgi:MFS family permease